MRNVCLLAVMAFTLLLSSCAQQNNMSKGTTGGVSGAAAGALIGQAIGNDTSSTLLGAAIGSVLGYAIGNEMDKADQQQLGNAYDRGPSGQEVSWVNPDSGTNYNVTPQPAYTNPTTNQVCRQAEVEAIIDGKREKTYATACRNSSGQWILQN